MNDRVTRRLGCDPDFTGEPETWLQTLDEVLPQDSIEFFQRFVGYCLTGYTREHVFLFAYGSGRNGKSTVIGTVERLLGEYWRGIPHTGLAGSKHEQHSEWLARLEGARLVTGLELPENGSWNLPLLKSLVGVDKITSRHMRQSSFEFTPACKIVIAGNHKPNLGRVDRAIEERLVLLPFVNKFTETSGKKRDLKLREKLEADLPKIMAWATEGVKKYLEDGLGGKPQTARDAGEQYLMEQDCFGGWVDERLVIDAGAFAPSKDLLKDYNEYAGAHLGKITPISEYLAEKYGRKQNKSVSTREKTQSGALHALDYGRQTMSKNCHGVTVCNGNSPITTNDTRREGYRENGVTDCYTVTILETTT